MYVEGSKNEALHGSSFFLSFRKKLNIAFILCHLFTPE